MNTLEINNILKHYKCFKGVYPIDKIPKINNGVIIINTDISTGPGKHWVALSMCKNLCEYFDSFGLPPLHNELITILNKFKGYLYNTVTLQNVNSSTCGNYCVIYASLRCRGYKYNQIINIFTSNTKINDKIVSTILQNLMPKESVPVKKPITSTSFTSVTEKSLLLKDAKEKNWEKRKDSKKKNG